MTPPDPPNLAPADVGPRVLVTGGAGYLGRALATRLRGIGCEVRTLDISALPGPGHLVADLRDYDSLAPAFDGVDTVFHTAALISIVAERRAPPAVRRAAYEINVAGTEHVIRAARAAGARRLVHTSSINVVMDHPIDGGDETLPYATRVDDLYSMTKIAAEQRVLAANDESLRTVAIRPAGIWGPGRGGMMLDAFVRELARGAFKATIGPAAPLDNVHLENVVDAMLLATRALDRADGVGGRAYFVTDGERIGAMEWFRPVVEGLGERFPRIEIPASAMMPVARGLELAHRLGAPNPTLTCRSLRNLTDGAHFSIAAAARDLGYRPRYGHAHVELLLPELRAHYEELRATA